MKDVMFDLETLGLNPGDVVLSIGAVQFDRYTGQLGETFYKKLETKTQTDHGLKIDEGTVQWWDSQDPTVRAEAFSNQEDTASVLKDFRLWYKFSGSTAIWANGANFDPPMLVAVYRAFGQAVPWHYRHPRDTRTVFDLVSNGKELIGKYGTKNDAKHDALQDAIWQAVETSKAIMELTRK